MIRTISTAGANVYLIRGENGYVLIDSGMAGKHEELRSALTGAGSSPADISLIIVTHPHIDHSGGLAFMKNLSGAPVLCQRDAAEYLRTGASAPVVPRTLLGKLIFRILPDWKAEGVEADITFDDEIDLSPYGLAGKAIHTPGHAPGSLSVVLDSGDAFSGDLFRGRPGKLSLGFAYDDRAAVLESMRKIAAFSPRVIHMSHGTTTDANELEAFISRLERG